MMHLRSAILFAVPKGTTQVPLIMNIQHLITRNNTPITRGDPLTDVLSQPYTYLEQLPGNNKKIRAHFLQAFNDLYFGIQNPPLLQAMNEVVDILHDCLLIIDDVEDSSTVRRGATAAHLRYGIPSTINCVNYMYFVAIHKANQLSKLYTKDEGVQKQINDHVNQVIIDEMLNLHHGQGVDIYWRDNKHSIPLPTEEEYLEMVMDKTGGLLRIMVKLLQAFKPASSDTSVPLTSLIGMIYQLRDDYFNLTSDKYSHMKGMVGEDLIEGKFSFPILHSLRGNRESSVGELLYQHDLEGRKHQGELIKQAIEFMEGDGSLEYTNGKLKECLRLAETMVGEESGGDERKRGIYGILKQLSDT